MNKKYYYLFIGVIVILFALVVSGFFGNTSSIPGDGQGTGTSTNGVSSDKSNLIVADSPQPNATVSSPIRISGKARGNWFFEASFPARVFDANGNQLGVVAIQATGDWMTTEFVEFEGSLPYSMPTSQTGILVLEKDNPSDLREFDDSIVIPVRFAAYDANAQPAATSTSSVTRFNVYLGKSGTSAECEVVTAVPRQVAYTAAVGKASIEELLKGPTPAEVTAGYVTSIPAGVTLRSLVIADGVARADFSARLDDGVAGSCRVGAIRSQITETLKQFPTVNSVIISINGSSSDILQP